MIYLGEGTKPSGQMWVILGLLSRESCQICKYIEAQLTTSTTKQCPPPTMVGLKDFSFCSDILPFDFSVVCLTSNYEISSTRGPVRKLFETKYWSVFKIF